MPIVSAPGEFIDADLYISLAALFGRNLYAKCEGMNFGGSVKMKAAAAMIESAERSSVLDDDSILIESSSGNLGVALSIIAASKGLRFTCVTDRRCNQLTAATIRAYGTELIVVDQPDPETGYLGARLNRVRQLCSDDSRYVWLNQYRNQANWIAHYEWTAPGILKHFPDLDALFVGVGTSGTAMGCVRYLRDSGSPALVIAVDAEGSVSFGGAQAPRLIPGLGASVPPPLLQQEAFDDIVHVAETDTIRACRTLSAKGLLFGGSTGTVLSGAIEWLNHHDQERAMTSVFISPDMGDRYVNTIYNNGWVLEHFGRAGFLPMDCLAGDSLTTCPDHQAGVRS